MKSLLRIRTLLIAVSAIFVATFSTAQAATFTVVNTNMSGAGSLFQAITDANNLAGADTIVFDIPPAGPKTIQTFGFPNITDPVTIDATTQPGFAGTPVVELDGGGGSYGFVCNGGNNTVRGFAMNGFNVPIYFPGGSSSNRVEGCWLGLDLNGALVRTNSQGIVIESGRDNIIGGTNAAQRNVIAGTVSSGIFIYQGVRNVILGNYIGTDPSGSNSIGNGWNANGGWNDAAGIYLESGVSNIIGGTAAGARNVIAGNSFGINLYVRSSFNVIQGNYIGVNPSGATTPAGRRQIAGIRLATDSNVNQIGGTTPGAGNVISGHAGAAPFGQNDGWGIICFGSGLNVIQGNLIGTDASGTVPVGNLYDGLYFYGVSRTNTIGGTTAGARNVISGNGRYGIQLRDAYQNLVQGNYLGTQADGTNALGNGGSGIYIYSGPGNILGGPPTGAGNVVAFNGTNTSGVFQEGIAVTQFDQFVLTTGNTMRRNAIFENVGRGILLLNNNCSGCIGHNDSGDTDFGPNNLQNPPVLTNATTSGGSIAVSGRFNSQANSSYTLEFFVSPDLDASGYGEGKKYLGQAAVVTDGSGNTGFEAFFVDAGYTGQFISGTATDAAGNTSEFGPTVVADAPAGVIQFQPFVNNYPESFLSAFIDVVRLGGDGSTVTVHYATADGTATAGSDYVATSGTLTFGPGETTKQISVTLLNDTLNEPEETILFILDSPSVGAVLGSIRTNAIRLSDDDFIYLNAGDAGVTRPANGTATILFPIHLTQASSRTVSVNYATANITALAGTDYQATNGTVTLLPGVTNVLVPVTIYADGLQEGSKAFALNLSGLTNAVFGDAAGLGTIYDGTQGILQFSAASYTAGEGAGAAIITVTRTGGALGTVSVPFSAVAGTATAGSDFTPTNGVLTFNNGVVSRTFSVPLIEDLATESGETIQLQLGTPTGTSLGAPASAALIITDNDAPPALIIRAIPDGVTLAWPTQAAGFQLASSPSVPSTNWIIVTNSPVTEGAHWVVTNTPALSNRFYRLQQ
jgi:hypothetical protein